MDANEKVQTFSVLGALVNTSMLLISCMSFSLITVFRSVTDDNSDAYRDEVLLPVSRISSIVIMLAYLAYIFFQLVTHKSAMADDGNNDEESATISMRASIIMLFITTVIVAAASDMVVHAIKGISEGGHMSQHFIGMILLPIVGNACEHAAAVRFAMQDKRGLSVSIAIGSSTQIALFVVPFSVLMGWAMDRPMDLNFGTLNTAMITLSVIVVLSMVVDGQSNWLQGYLLLSVYTIIAVMYAYLPNSNSSALG
jgi:Ca2+:H+ antiporter